MTAVRKQLLFRDVDGLAFAAARGKLDPRKLPAAYTPQRLGPLLNCCTCLQADACRLRATGCRRTARPQ